MAVFSKCFASCLGSQLHPLAAAAVALSASFPRIILSTISRLSTTIAGNDKPTGYPEAENTCLVSEFLIAECGLCQSELSVILKRRPALVTMTSTHRAQQAVQSLRDSGFTEDQVRKTITRSPGILVLNADRQIKPKIDFMKTLGLTVQDFGTVISTEPRLLGSSLEKTLSPNVQYLQNLLGSEVNVSIVFKRVPYLLITRNGPEFWEKKLKHLASFGLLEDEIKELVKKFPTILNASMDKVKKNMDFFMHTAGLPAKFLLTSPMLVSSYSLECRIKPRHRVLNAVSAMQPSERPPSLISAVYLSERRFLKKYVQSSPHATKLLEIYSGKSALF